MSLADTESAASAAPAPAPAPAPASKYSPTPTAQDQERLFSLTTTSNQVIQSQAQQRFPQDHEDPRAPEPERAVTPKASTTATAATMATTGPVQTSSAAPIPHTPSDESGSIPTTNALSSSLKSRFSASAPLASLSSTTPTNIISPKPHPSYSHSPTASSTSLSAATTSLLMLSSSKGVATGRPDVSSIDAHVKTEDSESTLSPETHNTVPRLSSSPARQGDHSSTTGPRKEQKGGVTATSCANCGTTTTPLWRRASNGQTICNACGLYFKARNLTRPPWLKRNVVHKKGESAEEGTDELEDRIGAPSREASSAKGDVCEGGAAKTDGDAAQRDSTNDSECAGSCPGDGNCNGAGGAESCAGCPSFNQHQANRQNLVCANCRTTTTPLWRRDSAGNTICNACGLYFKLHNVHRPVTMKRAVIKRRKRVHLLATSPPPAPSPESQPPPANQQQSQQPQPSSEAQHQPRQKSRPLKQASDSPRPPATSDLEPSDKDIAIDDQAERHGHAATKRRRVQDMNGSRSVPAIEDFILPKRSANGQTEWLRRDKGAPPEPRRSISPMDMGGSGHDDWRYDSSGHECRRYSSSHHGSSYPPHPSSRDRPSPGVPQSSRYIFNLHQGNGQYQSTQSMSMSRYSVSSPPPSRHTPPHQQHPQSQHPRSHSQHRHQEDDNQSEGITMQGYQGPPIHRSGDMEDIMHSPSGLSAHSSGWNQRLPGYATVTSSAFNTRLSSTGVVRSGLNPNSPPLYPRQGLASPAESFSHYRQPGSPHGYHHSVSPQPSQGLSSRSPSVQNDHAIPQRTYASPSSASTGYSSSYSLPSIFNGGHGNSGDINVDRGMATSGPAHLPPISLPLSHHGSTLHQQLPRASEILRRTPEPSLHSHHQSGSPHHHQHHYSPRQRRPSSPLPQPQPSLPPINGVSASSGAGSGVPATALSGSHANNEVLQQTRQDLQREVTHLSMLLGRAAAVLSGLDHALGPNGASANGEEGAGHDVTTSLSADIKTSSALASLMALSASGADREEATKAGSGSVPISTSLSAASAPPLAVNGTHGRVDDQRMHSPPLPLPLHSPSSSPSLGEPHRHSQGLSYPLSRRE